MRNVGLAFEAEDLLPIYMCNASGSLFDKQDVDQLRGAPVGFVDVLFFSILLSKTA